MRHERYIEGISEDMPSTTNLLYILITPGITERFFYM